MPKQGQLSKVTPQEHVVLVADAAKAADVAGIAFAKEEVL